MPALDIKDFLMIGQAVVTVVGVIVALKTAVTRLESGQTELLRQVGAVHKRMDHHAERLTKTELELARQDERQKAIERDRGLYRSQRFRLDGGTGE